MKLQFISIFAVRARARAGLDCVDVSALEQITVCTDNRHHLQMAAGVSDDVTLVARVMPGDLDTDTALLSGPRSVTVRSATGGAGQTFELEHQLDGSASQQGVWEEIRGQELLGITCC